MVQVMSAQGTVYECVRRSDATMVLRGVALPDQGVLSPLPEVLTERISRRRWRLERVDERIGLTSYLPV